MVEFNAREMKCLWKSELCDDTLKELYISETLYCEGQRPRAMFRLAVQATKRIPLIQKQAGQTRFIDTRELKGDIQKVIDTMKENAPCDEVKKVVREVDTKWARRGYQAFAACERGI